MSPDLILYITFSNLEDLAGKQTLRNILSLCRTSGGWRPSRSQASSTLAAVTTQALECSVAQIVIVLNNKNMESDAGGVKAERSEK